MSLTNEQNMRNGVCILLALSNIQELVIQSFHHQSLPYIAVHLHGLLNERCYSATLTKANVTSCSLLSSLNLHIVRIWRLVAEDECVGEEACGHNGVSWNFCPFHRKACILAQWSVSNLWSWRHGQPKRMCVIFIGITSPHIIISGSHHTKYHLRKYQS